MNVGDIEYVQFMQQMIKDESDKGIKNLKYTKAYPATVVSVVNVLDYYDVTQNTTGTFESWFKLTRTVTASVKIAGDTALISNLKNKSGVVLAEGDDVYLFSPTNDLTNLYISAKF